MGLHDSVRLENVRVGLRTVVAIAVLTVPMLAAGIGMYYKLQFRLDTKDVADADRDKEIEKKADKDAVDGCEQRVYDRVIQRLTTRAAMECPFPQHGKNVCPIVWVYPSER